MTYFELNLKSIETDINQVSENWLSKMKGKLLCSECGFPKPGIAPIDVCIENPPIDTPVNICGHSFIGLIRIDLLQALGESILSKHLWLGNAVDTNGKKYPQFRTFVGREEIFIRGNKKSIHHICSECGRMLYTAVLPRYLVSSQTKSRRPVYGNEGGILINQDLRKRLDKSWNPQMSIYPLSVLDQPNDGLRREISTYPTSEELIGYKPNISDW